MPAILLLLVPLVPLLLAIGLAVPAWRGAVWRLAPWAALPALVVALSGWGMEPVSLPWLLVGTELGLDDTSRWFLGLTAALWLAAGLFGAAYHAGDDKRFSQLACFLVAMAGNLLLIIAADAVTFYLGFLTMSLSAYGLIVHSGEREAWRAGTVYLVLVVLGEALILPALWLAVADAESISQAAMAAAIRENDLAIGLLIAGLGIKAGLVPLHLWLPLAHPVAPTPASAVLSGAMVKAGLLGWLALLPLGEVSRPDLALILIGLGLAGAFGAAVYGCLQRRAKAVLAYSTISQMGLMIAGVGMAWYSPAVAAPALIGVSLYALHHALAKGALFLGVGCVEAAAPARRRWVLALLLLPALALAGAPLTSGAVAKLALKHGLADLPAGWYAALNIALPLAAVGTTLLMARFWWLAARLPATKPKPGLLAPWVGLCVAVASVCLVPAIAGEFVAEALSPTTWWAAIWPVAAGGLIALLASRRRGAMPVLPEGDLVWPLMRLGRAVAGRWPGAALTDALTGLQAAGSRAGHRLGAVTASALDRGEAVLTRWPALGAAMLAVLVLGWWLVA